MNFKSIFTAILMFFTDILSSIKNVFNDIFKNDPIISNSTTVPTIPIPITEIIEITDSPTFEEANEVMCTYGVEVPDYSYFPACDSSYDSIMDALKSVGAKSEPTYRATIAELNGIKDYKLTDEQNKELLNKLKSGTLIKSKEIKIETKTIPCDKETTSITIEVIPTPSPPMKTQKMSNF